MREFNTDYLDPRAAEILEFGGANKIPDNRPDLQEYADELACSDGFGYGLFEGGYVKPEAIVTHPKALEELKDAIRIVGEYKLLWEAVSSEM